MKRLIALTLIILCSLGVKATNRYVDAIAGLDANAGTIGAPWKTLAKVNTIFSTLLPGDSILFKRGQTFFGVLKPNASGNSTTKIVIGAYGTGPRPEITALQDITTWTSLGTGVYKSTAVLAAGLQPSPNPKAGLKVVVVDGVMQNMGRYPNADAANDGWLNFESHVGCVGSGCAAPYSIIDSQLTVTPYNWSGADLVLRTNHYIIDRTKITGHTAGTLTYSPAVSYTLIDKWGYFIENDIRTLDQLGEWYYNSTTSAFNMYFGSSLPSAHRIRASVYDTLVNIASTVDYVTFDNITFTGGNFTGVWINTNTGIIVQNCDILYSGERGVFVSSGNGCKVINCTIGYANALGLYVNANTGGTFTGNTIKSIGMLKGLGMNNANQSMGIRDAGGSTNTYQYNTVDSTGFIGIKFSADYTKVINNTITNFCQNKDDGGGIYSTDITASTASPGRQCSNNIIVFTGTNCSYGTNNPTTSGSVHGIYMDDYSHGIAIIGNTIINTPSSGIILHNAFNETLRLNTIYGAGIQLLLSHNLTHLDAPPITGNIVRNNIFFSKDANQLAINLSTSSNDASATLGTLDSNLYCRPLDDGFIDYNKFINASGTSTIQDMDLTLVKSFYSKEAHGSPSSDTITRHAVIATIGANKFTNGTFNANVTGVSFGTTTSSAVRSWVGSGGIDAGTHQVVISSTKPGVSTATIPMGAVSTTKKYIVSFTVKNTKDTLLYVYVRQASAPYKVLSNGGSKRIIRMNTIRKEYEFAFQPIIDDPTATLFLESAQTSGTWWFDNIRIFEADVNITNPSDSIDVIYNASPTAQTYSLTGGGTRKNARGQIFTTSVTIPPYSSEILIKKGGTVGISPTVSISSPADNAVYTAPASITINATAADADGTVASVAFYNGAMLLGTDVASPFSFSWTSVPVGTYSLTARATDNTGLMTTSSIIHVTVNAASAPTVSISIPTADTTFTSAPATVNLTATAATGSGTITNVDFYDNGVLIGSDATSPYTLSYTNVGVGTHPITAIATSSLALSTESIIRNIVVTSNPVVNLVTPIDGTVYDAPATVNMLATATDADGIQRVEFYNGATLLHTEFNGTFSFIWTGVAVGTYSITAKAFDKTGASTVSDTAVITVQAANVLPTISIATPANNSIFGTPATVSLTSTTNDADGTVATVNYYNGSTLIGTASSSPFLYDWSPAIGVYTIHAEAVDNRGGIGISSNITVTISASSGPVRRDYIKTKKKPI